MDVVNWLSLIGSSIDPARTLRRGDRGHQLQCASVTALNKATGYGPRPAPHAGAQAPGPEAEPEAPDVARNTAMLSVQSTTCTLSPPFSRIISMPARCCASSYAAQPPSSSLVLYPSSTAWSRDEATHLNA